MHILHISGDFCNTKVYTNLYQNLARQGVEQTIYCPVRNKEQMGKNGFFAENTKIIYDHVVKPYYKYVYHVKRANVFQSLQEKVNLEAIDLVHAATLFTDGGQAYLINQKYNIPYVVAVRNTDINGFLSLLPHTWPAGKKILRNAQRVFFISKALMEKFSNHKAIQPILSDIKHKMALIPNGIDDYYLDHVNHEQHEGHKILYVGDFSNNKNVVRLGKAILELREKDLFKDITLTLVGGGNDTTNRVQNMLDAYPEVIHYIGPIFDKEKLCKVLNTHSIFAMPSIHETFGLVYLEALSQNLPIIFTKGQGVDGLFDSSVGIGVNPLSVTEIKEAIETISEITGKYSNKTIDFNQFRWSAIATRYVKHYNDLLN
jgi:glycosyltransferase involved in cell wall biosynthesis